MTFADIVARLRLRDEWGGSIFPMVPGYEIVGKITKTGSQVTKFKVGESAGIGCFVDSCRHCPSCLAGLEQYCDVGMVATYNGRDKEGNPTYGGYSNQIIVDENYALHISDKLPLSGVAPLLCAHERMIKGDVRYRFVIDMASL